MRRSATGRHTVEEAKSLETELDVVEGMQFDRANLAYFVTNADKMRVEMDDRLHLITRRSSPR